jgi:ribosome-associated protein
LDELRVNRRLVIPADELQERFTTSSGPGGQHANKVSTRVEMEWNVEASRVLGPRQRERIKSKLSRRIDSGGVLHVASEKHRSQLRNRTEVRTRLAQLVAHALVVEKSRVKTKPTRAANQRRLEDKKRRSQVKRTRRVIPEE